MILTVRCRPSHYLDLIPISLLAFEAAGQVCLSRVLSFAHLPTIVVSTLYHDLAADSLFFAEDLKAARKAKGQDAYQGRLGRRMMLVNGRRQGKQVQRWMCVACLAAGAATSANLAMTRAGAAGSLWMAAGVKSGLLVSVWLWKAECSDVVAEGHGVGGGGGDRGDSLL